MRCDNQERTRGPTDYLFQSTHLVWGATKYLLFLFCMYLYFNPRTSCEVRHFAFHFCWKGNIISIHAPRVRCDNTKKNQIASVKYFNPRTSCEVRPSTFLFTSPVTVFQSTHLVWGATPFLKIVTPAQIKFQSTHLVWGATTPTTAPIHAPITFQSTHLVWGATFHT